MKHYPQVQLADSNSKYGQWANKLFDVFVAPLMRLRPFQMAYSRALNDSKSFDLWTKVLQQLNTTLFITPDDLARIPKTGPVIIVANHPHGIMDGMLLGSLMHRVRDDFKVIMNEATTMPGLDDYLLFVSIFGPAKETARKNMQIMRETLEWLRQGHAIVVFPAGEISAIRHSHEKVALDNTWSTNIIRLSMRSGAVILPLFIVGQNDALFLKLGLIHPVLRTLQIGRVTNQLCGETLSIRASQPISHKLLEVLKDDVTRTDFIRAKLYALISRQTQTHRVLNVGLEEVTRTCVTSEQMHTAFDILEGQALFKVRENSTYSVFVFNQQQLLELNPNYADTFSVLKNEIGRLRELTFREVGEGSGQARDLDQFDEYYHHLTLWDRQEKQLIGAYRLAFTDEIFPKYGVQGLYTALQFDYAPQFFTHIGPAMELSRAFIIKAHQKNHLSLSTLLGAASEMLSKSQKARTFFGAVSISNEFQSISKKLILDFLARYHGVPELSAWVKPKNPPQLATHMPCVEWQRLMNTVQDLSLLNTVVSGIEADGKGVPPLIAAYLSVMGRFVAFDHDTGFNSIDGLLVLDMHEVVRENNPMMRRLMGKKSFDTYKERL
jgi:putative hemolysin